MAQTHIYCFAERAVHPTWPATEHLPVPIRGLSAPLKRFAFDVICEANGIEHRLTKPNHPWTNVQVERISSLGRALVPNGGKISWQVKHSDMSCGAGQPPLMRQKKRATNVAPPQDIDLKAMSCRLATTAHGG